MKIFALTHADYDESTTHTLLGPPGLSDSAFYDLCDSLLPEAAEHAIAHSKKAPRFGRWVGWDGIIRSLTQLLTERFGFSFPPVTRYGYSGTSIITDMGDAEKLPEAACQLVVDYNQSITDRYKATTLDEEE